MLDKLRADPRFLLLNTLYRMVTAETPFAPTALAEALRAYNTDPHDLWLALFSDSETVMSDGLLRVGAFHVQ
jgi:hypothetical protein